MLSRILALRAGHNDESQMLLTHGSLATYARGHP
jgi:hypothetical protein